MNDLPISSGWEFNDTSELLRFLKLRTYQSMRRLDSGDKHTLAQSLPIFFFF